MFADVRYWLLATITLCLVSVSLPRYASGGNDDLRLVAYGVVQQVDESSPVHGFVLVDQPQQVTYRLIPTDRVQLETYAGRQVRIQGRMKSSSQLERRTIFVEQIASTDKVAPAHFIQVAQRKKPPRDDSEGTSAPQPKPKPQSAPEPGPEAASELGLEAASEPDSEPDTEPRPLIGDRVVTGPLPYGAEPWIMDDGTLLLEGAPVAASSSDWYANYMQSRGGASGWPEVLWVDLDYLVWWTRGAQLPPLVTTSPSGTPADAAGVLGVAGTTVLVGNQNVLEGSRNGMRLRIGSWLGSQRKLGLMAEYIGLQDLRDTYGVGSNGVAIVARPFTDVGPAAPGGSQPASRLVSYPGQEAGGVTVDTWTKLDSFALDLRGRRTARANGRYRPCDRCFNTRMGKRMDLVGGYRYLRLDDQLTVYDRYATSIQPQFGLASVDQFITGNEFHGFEFGLMGEWYRNQWTLEGLFKMALGQTRQTVWINGGTEQSTNGIGTTESGGLLALSTNSGQYKRWKNDLILEFGLTAGYAVTPQLQLTAGYTIIYWPHVVRMGDPVDLNVNPTFLPEFAGAPAGLASPTFAFQDTQFWAQGFNFGLDYRW